MQIQPQVETVQGCLETQLEKVLGHPVRIRFAGRTDARVHALGQVVAFETSCPIPLEALAKVVNRKAGFRLALEAGIEALPEFHPRFDATLRTYLYRLGPSGALPRPWNRNLVSTATQEYDFSRLEGRERALLGMRDYYAFCTQPDREPQTIRSLDRLEIHPFEGEVRILVQGRSFLRGMVRHLVGALLRVATRERDPESLFELLELSEARKKDPTLRPAPPEGLYLWHVAYPEGSPGNLPAAETEFTRGLELAPESIASRPLES